MTNEGCQLELRLQEVVDWADNFFNTNREERILASLTHTLEKILYKLTISLENSIMAYDGDIFLSQW